MWIRIVDEVKRWLRRRGPINVKDYGAVGDGVTVTDAAMTNGSAVLTSATAAFTSADVGKLISIRNAGAAGVGLSGTIAGYTNATTVTMSVAASSTVTGKEASFGRDDTAALQAAIDAAPVGATVRIPKGLYLTTAALTITKHLELEGEGMHEAFKSQTEGGGLNGPVSPWVVGAVIKPTTAGQNGLSLTTAGRSINLKRFGIVFAPGIADTNTGHGIYAKPTQQFNGHDDSGIQHFLWEEIAVNGHDGNHYAFYLVNSVYGNLRALRSHGGGGAHIECNATSYNTGNSVWDHLCVDMNNAGTANGVNLSARTASGSGGQLGLMTFIRPGILVGGAAAAAGTQYAWLSGGGAAQPQSVTVISPNIEITTGSACTIDFGGVQSGTTIIRGGLMTNAPTGGYSGPTGYRVYTASSTFVVPNGVTQIRMRLIAGGGGGGGGGSASSSIAQGGTGGGGAGQVVDMPHTVLADNSYAFTIGAGGTAGTGGAAGGNTGVAGGNGGNTTFDGISATGGGGGGTSGANTATPGTGGWFARVGATIAAVIMPGFGGNGGNGGAGQATSPMPPAVVGGGGGGSSSTTLGGGGGAGATASPSGQAGGAQGASGTTAGVNGTTATLRGCGGGGGGGGANGGAGGNGGAGCAGQVEIWW